MNQSCIMRRANGGADLQHDRNGARGIERTFVCQKIAEGAAFEQLHDNVKIAIVGRAKVRDRNCIRMLHATGRARFATKTLLGCLIADKSLAQNFERDRTIDEQMRRAIDGAHAAAAEPFIQTVLTFKRATYERIDGNVGDGGIGLQRGKVTRTDEHIVGKLTAASWALKHIDLIGELRNIMTQKEQQLLVLLSHD